MSKIFAMKYIHPTAVLIGDVSLGEGSSVWPYAVLRADQGPIHIGKETSIQDHVVVHGKGVSIGDRCTVGHSSVIHGCRIGNDVLVGMNATILNGAEIGDRCIIGAGAVVTEGKKIESGSLVLGIPGKVARSLTEDDFKLIKDSYKEYLSLAKDAKR
jgi:carbonic anhydrase/acetyltransferase-like protein (isoleucine patch superfamily)